MPRSPDSPLPVRHAAPAARRAVALVGLLATLAACGDGPSAPDGSTSRPPVASVVVVAPLAALPVGATYQLVATPRAADDAPLADRTVTYATENAAVATVSAAGVVSAHAPGTAWLTVTCEGRTARLQVEVAAAPVLAPTIAALEPAAIRAGGTAAVTVRVLGANFAPGTTARWNGAARPTTVVSLTELRVTLPSGDLEVAAEGALTVHAPGTEVAALARLPIVAAPTVAALVPASVVVGAAEGFTLTLRGVGFTAASTVTWNGAARAATFVSGEELRVAVTPADVAAAGERTIVVTTDGPAGGRAEVRFPVTPRAAFLAVDARGGDFWTWVGHGLVLEARALDATSTPVTAREATWRVGDAATLTLAPGGPRSAVLQGAAVGRTWAEASFDGLTTRRTIAVHDVPPFDLVYAVGTGEARGIGVWSPRTGGTLGRFVLPVLAFDPAPSPDGRFIAFTGVPRNAGVDANHDVYVVHRDGSGLRRVTTDAAWDGQPSWSPDGTRLAFTSARAGLPDVYTMAIDGSDVRRLTEARLVDPLAGAGNAAVTPTWSPDGARLAYTVGLNGRSRVWTMRADGTDKRALEADATADDLDPAWTSDGARIAFRRVPRTGGAARLLTLDAATGGNAGTWSDLDVAGLAAFSPDGRWLTVSSPVASETASILVRPLFANGGGARAMLTPTQLSMAASRVRWIRRP